MSSESGAISGGGGNKLIHFNRDQSSEPAPQQSTFSEVKYLLRQKDVELTKITIDQSKEGDHKIIFTYKKGEGEEKNLALHCKDLNSLTGEQLGSCVVTHLVQDGSAAKQEFLLDFKKFQREILGERSYAKADLTKFSGRLKNALFKTVSLPHLRGNLKSAYYALMTQREDKKRYQTRLVEALGEKIRVAGSDEMESIANDLNRLFPGAELTTQDIADLKAFSEDKGRANLERYKPVAKKLQAMFQKANIAPVGFFKEMIGAANSSKESTISETTSNQSQVAESAKRPQRWTMPSFGSPTEADAHRPLSLGAQRSQIFQALDWLATENQHERALTVHYPEDASALYASGVLRCIAVFESAIQANALDADSAKRLEEELAKQFQGGSPLSSKDFLNLQELFNHPLDERIDEKKQSLIRCLALFQQVGAFPMSSLGFSAAAMAWEAGQQFVGDRINLYNLTLANNFDKESAERVDASAPGGRGLIDSLYNSVVARSLAAINYELGSGKLDENSASVFAQELKNVIFESSALSANDLVVLQQIVKQDANAPLTQQQQKSIGQLVKLSNILYERGYPFELPATLQALIPRYQS